MVGVLFSIYFLNSTFPYYGAGVINAYMAKALNLDRTTIGLGFSIFSVSLALTSPLVGICIDRLGIRLTLFCGGLLIMLGALLMTLMITGPWHYNVVFGVIVGAGVSMGGAIPVQAGVTNWFKKRKAIAMSVVLSAAGIGGLLAAPLLNKVIDTFDNNWKMGWFVVMATAALSAALAGLGVRNKPEDLGQVPDGIQPSKEPAKTSGAGLAGAGKVYHSSGPWKMREALKTKALWLIILASVAFLMPYVTCVAHTVMYLQDMGHPESFAALSVGLLVFFSIIGRLLGGGFGDRVEPRVIWFFGLCSVLAGMVVLTKAGSLGSISVYIYTILVGAGFGAAYVCMATIVGNYFGAQSFAPIMGMIFPIIFLAAALGPFLAGSAYDNLGSYHRVFYGLTALAFTGAIIILFAKPPIAGTQNEP